MRGRAWHVQVGALCGSAGVGVCVCGFLLGPRCASVRAGGLAVVEVWDASACVKVCGWQAGAA
eukprot:12925623-Alexandrium_andersonii.AAC.1